MAQRPSPHATANCYTNGGHAGRHMTLTRHGHSPHRCERGKSCARREEEGRGRAQYTVFLLSLLALGLDRLTLHCWPLRQRVLG